METPSRETILAIYAEGPDAVITLVESLCARISVLESSYQKLESSFQSLQDQVSRNSSNSSKPPSSDGFKRPVSTRVSSVKPQGGQPGHEGHHKSLTDKPDKIILHTPTTCPACGESLESSPVIEEERRQCIDIPRPVAEVIEHKSQTKVCSCCRQAVKAEFPSSVRSRISYGPTIASMCVYLVVEHSVSIDRTSDIIESFSGHRPSAATVYSMMERCSDAIEPVEKAIIEALVSSDVIHVDESGARLSQELNWLHSSSTDTLTYYSIHAKRGEEAMNDIGILPRFKGIAVHDFWKPYLKFECTHSFCNAHLLRELQWFSEQRKHPWADQIAATLGRLLHLSRDDNPNQEQIADALNNYDRYIKEALSEHPEAVSQGKRGRVKQSQEHNLLVRLKTYKDDIVRFVHDKRVPFTNNQAERDIRPLKTKLKVSGCFRSKKGAQFYCRIRSYCSTAFKQKFGAWKAILNACWGKPFYPAH